MARKQRDIVDRIKEAKLKLSRIRTKQSINLNGLVIETEAFLTIPEGSPPAYMTNLRLESDLTSRISIGTALSGGQYRRIFDDLAIFFGCDRTRICMIMLRKGIRHGQAALLLDFRYAYSPEFSRWLSKYPGHYFDRRYRSQSIPFGGGDDGSLASVLAENFYVTIDVSGGFVGFSDTAGPGKPGPEDLPLLEHPVTVPLSVVYEAVAHLSGLPDDFYLKLHDGLTGHVTLLPNDSIVARFPIIVGLASGRSRKAISFVYDVKEALVLKTGFVAFGLEPAFTETRSYAIYREACVAKATTGFEVLDASKVHSSVD